MIVIEGYDGAGKSTFTKLIKEKIPEIPVIKPYYPKTNQLSYYLHSGSQYSGSFLERYYLSELVYPRFKSDRRCMEDHEQFQIEAALIPFGPVIIFLNPDKETILETFRTRGDDYINEDEIDEMIMHYNTIIERSRIPHITYDFKKDNPLEVIGRALMLAAERKTIARELEPFLGSGDGISDNGIMFIGDDPSDKSIGEGYLRAFGSNNSADSFFHKILNEAGVYKDEMPYFTNWGKGFDNDIDKLKAINKEIEIVKPRKIVSLGKNPILQSRIPLVETIEHPESVKRFGFKDCQWYINTLKQIKTGDNNIPK